MQTVEIGLDAIDLHIEVWERLMRRALDEADRSGDSPDLDRAVYTARRRIEHLRRLRSIDQPFTETMIGEYADLVKTIAAIETRIRWNENDIRTMQQLTDSMDELRNQIDENTSILLTVRGQVATGPRQLVAERLSQILLALLWSSWLIKELRDYYIREPVQAVIITMTVVIAALIIRWLPEDDRPDE